MHSPFSRPVSFVTTDIEIIVTVETIQASGANNALVHQIIQLFVHGVPPKISFLNFLEDMFGTPSWVILGHLDCSGPVWTSSAILANVTPFVPFVTTSGHFGFLGHFGPFESFWAILRPLGNFGFAAAKSPVSSTELTY